MAVAMVCECCSARAHAPDAPHASDSWVLLKHWSPSSGTASCPYKCSRMAIRHRRHHTRQEGRSKRDEPLSRARCPFDGNELEHDTKDVVPQPGRARCLTAVAMLHRC